MLDKCTRNGFTGFCGMSKDAGQALYGQASVQAFPPLRNPSGKDYCSDSDHTDYYLG